MDVLRLCFGRIYPGNRLPPWEEYFDPRAKMSVGVEDLFNSGLNRVECRFVAVLDSPMEFRNVNLNPENIFFLQNLLFCLIFLSITIN